MRAPDDGEVLRGAGLEDCDGTACGRHVCLHGGTCTPAGDTFVCSCTEVASAKLAVYQLPSCNNTISTTFKLKLKVLFLTALSSELLKSPNLLLIQFLLLFKLKLKLIHFFFFIRNQSNHHIPRNTDIQTYLDGFPVGIHGGEVPASPRVPWPLLHQRRDLLAFRERREQEEEKATSDPEPRRRKGATVSVPLSSGLRGHSMRERCQRENFICLSIFYLFSWICISVMY